MSMLGLALKAGVPLIRVHTTDLVNLPDVLRHVAGCVPMEWAVSPRGGMTPAKVHYAVKEIELTVDLYGKLVDADSSLVLVNQGEDSPLPFNAGEIPVPKEMVETLLREIATKDQIPVLMPCFSGLTLKTISEVVRLVMAQEKALTPKGVLTVRSALAGKLQGLAHVDTHLPLYLCPKSLSEWVARNKRFFLEAPDERLVPRGILLSGEPGTGKTTAAKYIAGEFDVELYRLDLSAALSKWVSESEANLSRILNTLDQEEPAVILIDEAEKLFAEREDSGVTARLLSQMLWWLAEHKSRVLTVATTNDLAALPKEFYREGRFDTTMTIEPLKPPHAVALAFAVFGQFMPKKPTEYQAALLSKSIRAMRGTTIPHAKVVQKVYDLIKEGTLGKLNFS